MPSKKKRTKKKHTRRNEDTQQRRKYEKGGRIEAYTFGEATGKKKDKIWG